MKPPRFFHCVSPPLSGWSCCTSVLVFILHGSRQLCGVFILWGFLKPCHCIFCLEGMQFDSMGNRTFVLDSHCNVEICWADKRGVNEGKTNGIKLRMFIIKLKKFGGGNFCLGGWLSWRQWVGTGVGWNLSVSHIQFGRVCVMFCCSCFVINSFYTNLWIICRWQFRFTVVLLSGHLHSRLITLVTD